VCFNTNPGDMVAAASAGSEVPPAGDFDKYPTGTTQSPTVCHRLLHLMRRIFEQDFYDKYYFPLRLEPSGTA
jgi:hypothetical protein